MSRRYQCHRCKRRFWFWSGLRWHMLLEHPVQLAGYSGFSHPFHRRSCHD